VPVLSLHTLQPDARTTIGQLLFDPSRIPPHEDYLPSTDGFTPLAAPAAAAAGSAGAALGIHQHIGLPPADYAAYARGEAQWEELALRGGTTLQVRGRGSGVWTACASVLRTRAHTHARTHTHARAHPHTHAHTRTCTHPHRLSA
jgi:hypothetical protein